MTNFLSLTVSNSASIFMLLYFSLTVCMQNKIPETFCCNKGHTGLTLDSVLLHCVSLCVSSFAWFVFKFCIWPTGPQRWFMDLDFKYFKMLQAEFHPLNYMFLCIIVNIIMPSTTMSQEVWKIDTFLNCRCLNIFIV